MYNGRIDLRVDRIALRRSRPDHKEVVPPPTEKSRFYVMTFSAHEMNKREKAVAWRAE